MEETFVAVLKANGSEVKSHGSSHNVFFVLYLMERSVTFVT